MLLPEDDALLLLDLFEPEDDSMDFDGDEFSDWAVVDVDSCVLFLA